MQQFELRPVREQDAALLYSMILEMATYEKERDEVVTSEEKIRNTICNDSAAHAYIGYLDGQPAAYVMYYYTYSSYYGQKRLYIEDIFVRPDYRKSGLGKRIMSHMARQALQEHCCKMDWTCLNWNRNAIDFYTHIGGKLQEDRLYFRADEEGLQYMASQQV